MQSKKGKTFTKIHFTFSTSLDDILDDVREEISHANFFIFRQSLQDWDTLIACWVFFFDPRGDAKILTEHLLPAVKTIAKFEPNFTLVTERHEVAPLKNTL